MTRWNARVKRAFDFCVAFWGIFFLWPVMLLIALMVRCGLGEPVLFRQLRPGLQGQPFLLIKFRSMTDAKDAAGNLLPDAQRLLGVGRILRKSSLDELPQLWNVLKGEMSLVGPRPLLMEYLPLYSEEQARRHEVRPGITGWAQVNGRNGVSWDERFKLDVWYVDNHTFWLDLHILWLTVRKVWVREGIAAEGDVSMPKFKGNQS